MTCILHWIKDETHFYYVDKNDDGQRVWSENIQDAKVFDNRGEAYQSIVPLPKGGFIIKILELTK